MPERITSRKNELVREAAKLASSVQARREQGLFLVEGARLCADAAKSGVRVLQLFFTQQALQKYGGYLNPIEAVAETVFELEPHVAELLAETRSSQGVFCVCAAPLKTASLPAYGRHCLALENVQDPSNLGAVLRTAEALGAGGVLLAGSCCDAFSPKALRASMGAVFRMPIYFSPSLPQSLLQLKEKGFATFAAVPDETAKPVTAFSFGQPTVMAVGNEGNGLTREAVAACMHTVTIPMLGRAESLNAATSAAILMWEMMRGGGVRRD